MRLLAVACSLFLAPILSGQSLFDALHERGDTVTLGLSTDWKKLLRKKKEKTYQPASVAVSGHVLPARIRTRGHARLQQCRYPSLKIKLRKRPLDSLGYSKLNDLKLVVQCMDKGVGEAYLRREKLVYDLYEMLSPYHHRTVPVKITLDGGGTLTGFLVEDEEQLAARYGAKILEVKKISSRGLERTAYLDLALFNYLILNTDWNIFNLHNVECLYIESVGRPVPIPYDFDYSGFVGTSYAVPHESREQHSIYEPKWLGRHVNEEELRLAAGRFLEKREAFLDSVDRCHGLLRADRRRLLARLETFFDLLADDDKLLSLLD